MPFTTGDSLPAAILAHAIEAVPTAVSITDPQDRILYVNRAFLDLYGYAEEDLPALKVGDLRADRVPEAVSKAILPGTMGGGWQGILWQKRKDGSEFLIELVTSPVPNEEGRTIALVGVARDITEETRREARQDCLHEIVRAVQETPTLGRLFPAIRDIVEARIDAPGFTLFLRDASGALAVAYDSTAGELQPCPVERWAFARHLLTEGRPWRLSPAEWSVVAQSGALPPASTASTWLGAPLGSEREPFGAVVLRHDAPGFAYDDRDLELLGFIAGQISQAIERKRIEEERHADLSFKTALSVAVSNAGLGILILQEGRIVYANAAAAALTGFSTGELREKSFLDLVHPDEREAAQRRLKRHSATFLVGETYDSALGHQSGRRVEVEVSVQPFGFGVERRYVATLHDVTPLVSLARTDALTTLPNRKAVDEAFRKEWERARRRSGALPLGFAPERPISAARPGALLAMLMIDLDHFGLFNDQHGHLAGDETLRRSALVMRSCLRTADFLGRFGGEEFLVLLPDTDLPGAIATAERLRSSVERDVFFDVHEQDGSAERRLHVTVSVGVAAVNDMNEIDPHELLARADRALYTAKAMGRNRVAWE